MTTERLDTSGAVVIGGGPAGLMAAEVLAEGGVPVEVFEAKPSAGRKFLIAGVGGLNLTHSEPFESFLERYGVRQEALREPLAAFTPADLRAWAERLGAATFVGSSGRVFPVGLRAAPLLAAWRARLLAAGVVIRTRHRWLGWSNTGDLIFETPGGEVRRPAEAVLLALGGASWPQLGSDGAWTGLLAARGVPVVPLRPANCGFEVAWSEHFRAKFAGKPVKTVRLRFGTAAGVDFERKGEFIVSAYGVEGSLVYAASAHIRDALEAGEPAAVSLDLLPDLDEAEVLARLSRARGSRSLSSHLRRTLGIVGVKAGLLREFNPQAAGMSPAELAGRLKDLRVPINAARPIAEAISTAGGVPFEALTDDLMLIDLPGVFCAGEMLDWEAPTGGYLLTACFATGRAAGLGMLRRLNAQE